MDHDGASLGSVLGGVPEFEPLRLVEVELHGRECFLAAVRVSYLDVDLGTVERCLPLCFHVCFHVLDRACIRCSAKLILGVRSLLVGAEVLSLSPLIERRYFRSAIPRVE